ncbi:MAG TPA: protein-L-isoaspartate(D-aspartate) O-methyltransferase [Candidatus Sulfomarinibacteraceae bacterium]|nr:protein-L-isoaspartate(D-aspartate) O-methyltransferase [Candidatus Sulfomarinibacteraceae bacterium]
MNQREWTSACSWRLALCALLTVAIVGCDAVASTPATPTDRVVASPAATTPAIVATAAPAETDEYSLARQRMVDQHIVGLGVTDEAVVAAMEAVPRHHFVPEEFLSQAYNNHPLPIGFGQTISQPYVVALMTQAALVDGDDVVLEVGSGSGYQAAVLAEIADHVYTVEIIGGLAERAEDTLQALGYDNVTVRHSDGYFGWEEHAPYDAIVVTAAPDHIPQPLIDQLKVGAHMIIPVGPVGGFQTLWRVTKVSEDEVRTEDLGGVRFVPLTRQEQE